MLARRKIRRVIRKSSTRRPRRRRSGSAGNAAEIKYQSITLQNQSASLAIVSENQDILYDNQNILANVLDYITVGTDYESRIGNKIYVMSINVHCLVYGCPEDSTYGVDSFIFRHIWHNQRSAADTSIVHFFNIDAKVNFNSFPNRKAITVHRDKYFPVRGSAFTTTSSGSEKLSGPVREIDYSLPINRYVTYTPTGQVKEDRDVYSLATLVATAGVSSSSNNGLQVCCSQWKIRVYFKDA